MSSQQTVKILKRAVKLCTDRLDRCCDSCEEKGEGYYVNHNSMAKFYCKPCFGHIQGLAKRKKKNEQLEIVDNNALANIENYLASFDRIETTQVVDSQWAKAILITIETFDKEYASIFAPLKAFCLALCDDYLNAIEIEQDLDTELKSFIVDRYWGRLDLYVSLIETENGEWKKCGQVLLNIIAQLEVFNSTVKELFKFKRPLEATKFKIALIGATSVGKSTIINALLREIVLRMDVLPSTSGVIICSKGDTKSYFKQDDLSVDETSNDSTLLMDESVFDESSNFSQDTAQDFSQKTFVVTLPDSRILELDIQICDTPGFNQVKCGNIDSYTMNWLKSVDCIVCVLEFKDVKYAEDNILSKLRDNDLRPDILLYNKFDMVTDKEDIAKCNRHHSTLLTEYFGQVPSFHVSANKALDSIISKNSIPTCQFFDFEEHLLILIIQKLHDYPQHYSSRIMQVLENIITGIIEQKTIGDLKNIKEELLQKIEIFVEENHSKYSRKFTINPDDTMSELKQELCFDDLILNVEQYNDRVVARVVNALLPRLCNIHSIQNHFLTKLSSFLPHEFVRRDLPNPLDDKNDIIERTKIHNFGFWESTMMSKLRNIKGFFELIFQWQAPNFNRGERKKTVGYSDIDMTMGSVIKLFPGIMINKMKLLAKSIVEQEYNDKIQVLAMLKGKVDNFEELGSTHEFDISDLDELMKNYVDTYLFSNKIYYRDSIPKLKQFIGSGGYGVVGKTEWNGKTMAVKLIREANQDYPFYRELFILLILNTRYKLKEVVKLETILRDENNDIYIIQDELNMNLYKWNDEKPNKYQKLKIAIQIAQALQKIHSISIVHRDISPGNIMISFDNMVSLIDFGFGKMCLDGQDNSSGGTGEYRSPQVKNGGEYTYKCDIYSFGKILEFLNLSEDLAELHAQCTVSEERDRIGDWDTIIQQVKNNLVQVVSVYPKKIQLQPLVKMILVLKGDADKISELSLVFDGKCVATLYTCEHIESSYDDEKIFKIVWKFESDFSITDQQVKLLFGDIVFGHIEICCEQQPLQLVGTEIAVYHNISIQNEKDMQIVTQINSHKYYLDPCYAQALEFAKEFKFQKQEYLSLLQPDSISFAQHLLPKLKLIDLKRLYVVISCLVFEDDTELDTITDTTNEMEYNLTVCDPYYDSTFESIYFQLTEKGMYLWATINWCKISNKTKKLIIATPRRELLSKKTIPMYPKEKLALIVRIGKSFCYLHQHNLIYKDFYISNIVLDNHNWKLEPASLSFLGDDTSEVMTTCGTFSYIAPELMEGTQYSKESDLYSFGLFCLDILDDSDYNGLVVDRVNIEKKIKNIIARYKFAFDAELLGEMLSGLLETERKERLKSIYLENYLEKLTKYSK